MVAFGGGGGGIFQCLGSGSLKWVVALPPSLTVATDRAPGTQRVEMVDKMPQ